METKNRNITRAAGIIMIAILLSRILGFVREMIVANTFGRSMESDAFFASFAIPDLLYNLLIGGALSAAFIPIFSQYLALDQEEEGWKVASSFINLISLALFVLVVLGVVFAPYLVPLTAYKFADDPAKLSLTISLNRVMIPSVIFTALAGLSTGILNSYHIFAPSAFAPLLYNIGIIGGAILLGPSLGIRGMAIGVLVGAFGNLIVQIPAVLKKAAQYRVIIDIKHPAVQRMFVLALPAVLGLGIWQINLIVNQNIASALPEGAISALRYANRLFSLPLGIFAAAIATATFPLMTHQVARKEMGGFRSTVSLGVRTTLFVTVPAAVGLIVLANPIVKLLFERGAFTAEDTYATAFALVFYSIGLPAHSIAQVITRGFYALQSPKVPVIIGAWTVLINIILNLFFLRFTPLAHGGLALAFSLTGVANAAILLWELRKKTGGIDGRRITVSSLKATVASLIMGAAAWGTSWFLTNALPVHTLTGLALQVMVSVTAGVVTFVLCAYLLRMDELAYATELLSKRLMRKANKA